MEHEPRVSDLKAIIKDEDVDVADTKEVVKVVPFELTSEIRQSMNARIGDFTKKLYAQNSETRFIVIPPNQLRLSRIGREIIVTSVITETSKHETLNLEEPQYIIEVSISRVAGASYDIVRNVVYLIILLAGVYWWFAEEGTRILLLLGGFVLAMMVALVGSSDRSRSRRSFPADEILKLRSQLEKFVSDELAMLKNSRRNNEQPSDRAALSKANSV